jgi:hypothetical protein
MKASRAVRESYRAKLGRFVVENGAAAVMALWRADDAAALRLMSRAAAETGFEPVSAEAVSDWLCELGATAVYQLLDSRALPRPRRMGMAIAA